MGALSKLTIATTSALPHEPQRIKQWIQANGGAYSTKVAKGVTHLIASKDAWKKSIDLVKQASDLQIPIVSFDWLEDSLQSRRKLSEKKYTWKLLRRESKKKKQLKKMGVVADGKRFREGCEQAGELTGSGTLDSATTSKPRHSKSFFFPAPTPSKPPEEDKEVEEEIEDESPAWTRSSSGSVTSSPAARTTASPEKTKLPSLTESPAMLSASPKVPQAKIPHFKDLYHYYLDDTGFEYKIVLARSDPSINSFARYQIGLLESHTKPHTYCTVVQYTPPAGKASCPASDVSTVSTLQDLGNLLSGASRKRENGAVRNKGATDKVGGGGQTSMAKHMHTPSPIYTIPQQDSSQSFDNDKDTTQNTEATRLSSLVVKASPSPDAPYKDLICPMNSSYTSAWRAFRHAFRDLTLLSWEERFDKEKVLQTARARKLGVEPYSYRKPMPGLPMGLFPQEAGLHQGNTGGVEVRGDSEDGYVRNSFNLPGVSHPLTKTGSIGNALYREQEERERQRKDIERSVKIEMQEKGRRTGRVAGKKPNYNKPFFNGVSGTPQTDARDRLASDNSALGARTSLGGKARRSRPWPSERNW